VNEVTPDSGGTPVLRSRPESAVISRRSIEIPERDIEPSGARERPGWDTIQVNGLVWLRVSVGTRADHAVATGTAELDVAATGTLDRRLSALVGRTGAPPSALHGPADG
jgi:hypothetical protein